MSEAARTHYRVFGLVLASNFPFEFHLEGTDAAADIEFLWSEQAAPYHAIAEGSVLYRSPGHGPSGGHRLVYGREGDVHRLQFAGLGEFRIDGRRIVGIGLEPSRAGEIEIALFGNVLAFWLELHGVLALHAAAVVVDGAAVLLLARNGGGKTTMAAELGRQGYALLSDDIVPVELRAGETLARPGYDQMRMWPGSLRHFIGEFEHLPKVHPRLAKRRVRVGAGGLGEVARSVVPVGGIYLLDRQVETTEAGTRFGHVAPAAAVPELARHSFTPRLVAAAGLRGPRFEILCRLAESATVRTVSYGSDLGALHEVAGAIAADALTLARSAPRT